jgi:hypothetical protein
LIDRWQPPKTRASARQAAAASTSTSERSQTPRTYLAASSSRAVSTPDEPAAADADAEADADFLALSKRQQRAVDKAFDRGLRQVTVRRARKRRRVNDGQTAVTGNTEDAGGFVVEADEGDAGGFIVDDDTDQGGFMPRSDDDDGGFIVDDDDTRDGGFMPPSPLPAIGTTKPAQVPTDEPAATTIPLSSIPALLTSLNLPYDDDVLNVFRDSATGWSGSGAPSSSEGLAVARTDFRAVCAALMEPQVEDDAVSDEIPQDDEDADEDAYEDDGSQASTPLSSLGAVSDESFSGGKEKKGKGRGSKKDLEAQMGVAPKMTREQKDAVRQTWDMFLAISTQPQRGPRAIGRDEVRKWASELGESYSETEVSQAVTAPS